MHRRTRTGRPGPRRAALAFAACALAVRSLRAQAAERGAAASAWDGAWVLDTVRSGAAATERAADRYVFRLRPDGRIRWEIPSLGEVVTGRADGRPMPIRRPGAPSGFTLAVRRGGPTVLRYAVARNGAPLGEGRMTLVEDGRAWVDLTWPARHPTQARVAVYAREAVVGQRPASDDGRLNLELLRAVRLVVDPGLHAFGWSRDSAVAYLRASGAASEPVVQDEVNPYVARPAQALSYKVGQRKFLELRERARQRLGARFDVRAFHHAVLGGGPLPLRLLDAEVDRWIDRQPRAGAPAAAVR